MTDQNSNDNEENKDEEQEAFTGGNGPVKV